MQNLEEKTVVILGAARSGLAAVKLLKKKGAHIFVSDNAPANKKLPEIDILEKEQIDHEFGGHSEIILNADFVVLSPGISKKKPIVQDILSRRIPVYSELEVASWFCQSPIIAITGSNGKTTTTTLLGKMLRSEHPGSIVAGNIGDAFSDYVLMSKKSDWAAVEVSSFQLETIDRFHPRIVIILNLAPNHLDWYNGYEDYIQAKLLILKNLTPDDYLIYNQDDVLLSQKISSSPAQKVTFSVHDKNASAFFKEDMIYMHSGPLINSSEIKLKGRHNYQNAMAACLAADLTGIRSESMKNVLSTFDGVEHRLEFVAEINGVQYVNDSKATTVESLSVALSSFESTIILIAGGKDKGSDYTKVNPLISKHVREAIVIGAASEKIANAWKDLIPLHFSTSLKNAVKMASDIAIRGENVVLSPACSSYDMFNDYEERGRKFKSIVNRIKKDYEN